MLASDVEVILKRKLIVATLVSPGPDLGPDVTLLIYCIIYMYRKKY